MASRKKKTADKNDQQVFYQTLFTAIAREGWLELTLPRIAKITKTPLAELLKNHPDKNSVLIGFGAFLDRQLAEIITPEDAPIKDRLFEIIMQRLDILAPYKPGAIRLIDELQTNPFTAAALGTEAFCQTRNSATLMLELGGIRRTYGFFIPLRIAFELIYLQTLRTWKNDPSPDLSATMAQLDRMLERLLRFARLL